MWRSRDDESSQPDDIVSVCAVYAVDAKSHRKEDFGDQLRSQLTVRSGDSYQIEVTDIHEGIHAGTVVAEARRRILNESDILVVFLSAAFCNDELSNELWQSLACTVGDTNESADSSAESIAGMRGRRSDGFHSEKLIPVYARAFLLQHSDWCDVRVLPDDRTPLMDLGRSKRDKAWGQIAKAVYERASKIVAERQRRLPQRRTVQSILPTSRSPQSVTECLDQMEEELRGLPFLRFTEENRYSIWERLVDFLDAQNPTRKLKALLRAPSREQHAQHKLHIPEASTPSAFLPDDPLQSILQLLSSAEAAHWLYLGATYVRPKLKFPRWSGPDVDLVERLSSIPEHSPEQLALAHQTQKVFGMGCQSLLAMTDRKRILSADEIDLTIRILHEFRGSSPLSALPSDLSTIQFPGLLTVIGAQALFQGELQLAADAYRQAWRRSQHERNELAEWVSVGGLLLSLQLTQDPRGRRSTDELPEVLTLRCRQDELDRSPAVMQLREQIRAVRSDAQASLIDKLRDDLDTDRVVFRMRSKETPLSMLLCDQEEIGDVPSNCGETARLIANSCFLGSETNAIPDTVALLCRYGTRTDDGRAFVSTELTPAHPQWAKIFENVLQAGRTEGERAARLAFLKRHLTEMPIAFVGQARSFYEQQLEHYLRAENTSKPKLRGNGFFLIDRDVALDTIVEQVGTLVGYSQGGVEWLCKLLELSDDDFWPRMLSRCHRLAWRHWRSLGELSSATMTRLCGRIEALLDSQKGRWLFSPEMKGAHRIPWVSNIPLGIVKILEVLERCDVTQRRVDALHRKLCELLDRGAENSPDFDHDTFFTQTVTRWLASRQDEYTRQFVRRHILRLLDRIERQASGGLDVDSWAAIGENRLLLCDEDWQRMDRLVRRDDDAIASKIARASASLPLTWLAAALINQDAIPRLRTLGRKFLQISIKHPAGLMAAVSAKPERIRDMRRELEQAVLACAGRPSVGFGTPDRFGAIHNRVFFYSTQKPHCGWQHWLEPLLDQLSECPQHGGFSITALKTMDLVLQRIPEHTDQQRVLYSLCRLASSANGRIRDEAVYLLVRYRSLFDRVDPSRVDTAVCHFSALQTLATEWTLRQASLPVVRT